MFKAVEMLSLVPPQVASVSMPLSQQMLAFEILKSCLAKSHKRNASGIAKRANSLALCL
jgi:hypothetical protein